MVVMATMHCPLYIIMHVKVNSLCLLPMCTMSCKGVWSVGVSSHIQIKAVKEEPRDDAEVERKEERDIDKVFEESSSGEEEGDELTESGQSLSTWCGVCTFSVSIICR